MTNCQENGPEGLWGVAETAAFLKTTVHGIYKLVERRSIPHVRLGRRRLFDPAEIRAWVDRHRVPADIAASGKD
jgi:excisionase family DNA binding protein